MKYQGFFLYLCVPIPVQEISDQMRAELDAEGSDRYLFDQDIKPAINSAIDVLTALFNAAFAEKKLSPECLREITKVGVWQTNKFSRVAFIESDLGFSVWTIVGVYPKIKTNIGATSSNSINPSESKFRDNLSFIKSSFSAKRLTLEEWNENVSNAFMPGNTLLHDSLTEYAYLDFADYTSASYDGNKMTPEITIRPDVPNELVGIAYIKTPDKISNAFQNVEFPRSLKQLIVDIALNQISVKQSDGTNLYGITAQNIAKLTALMK